MANLSKILESDPTLDAVDAAIEAEAALELPRPYLGMSEIGESCARKLWYKFRFSGKQKKKAFLIKCADRGHRAEDIQAKRLRMVEGIELNTLDPVTGEQFEFSDHDGHFMGHCDGDITGLLQAPKAVHVWEHKEKEEKFFNKLKKIKLEVGEKLALRQWEPTYYAQTVLYMFYKGLKRHYMTVTVPGGRETESIRTNEDTAHALQMRERARRIIYSDDPPEKIGDESYYECKWCQFNGICHKDEFPDRSCRNCVHSTPVENGNWHCERFGKLLTLQEQIDGCPAHLILPSMVPGDVIEANQEKNFIHYKLKNGNEWTDSEAL